MDDFIMKLSQLVGGNLWLAPLIALLAGLLTSLTPCSLSTIPLILGCVGGLNEHEPKKAFRLSLTFAFGSMLTFTALGFAASLLGNLLNGLGPWLHLALALLLIAMALQAFRTNKYVDAAFYTLHPASTGLIAAAGWSVFALVLVNLDAYRASYQLADLLQWKNLILFAVIWVLTNLVKPLKKLHPVVFLALAAVVGIVFRLGGV